MEIEIKPHFPPRKVCIASFPGYIKATQQHFVCEPWLCSDFCAFCRRPRSTWGQMPFDVRAFIRKSCLKGGESWIKGNLSPPDATTGDSAIVYNTTRVILKLDFSTTVWNITRKNLEIFFVEIFTKFVNVQEYFTYSERWLHSIFDCDWFQLSKAINQLFPGGIVRNNKSSIKPLNYL